MLLFARSRLRQGALRWYARLDPSKKQDWDLFVEALFEQYPPVQAPAEAEISTPVWSATTFSPGASTAILPTDQGVDPHPDIHNERHATGVNTRQGTVTSELLTSYLIISQYELGVTNGVVAVPKEGAGYPGSVSKVWNVVSDGSLEVYMPLTSINDPSSLDDYGHYSKKLEDFKTSEVHLATPGTSIRFMKPGTPLWQNDPKRNAGVGRYDFKARVVFEPF
ncbi:hypothetical protein FRC00_001408 [Tulasnella sp. 408]|nr:hypothetical protein FRC00_001408 [Tulasnella sp. 408]